MANTITRRPLPALVLLLALLALTAIVWWRVLHRDTDSTAATPVRATCAPVAVTPTRTLGPPQSVTVVVLNSTQRNGIAGKARTTLIADGFKVPAKAADDKRSTPVAGTAEIRYGPAGLDAATLLHLYFPGSTYVRTATTSATVTVSLGEKYTSVATPGAVRAAAAKARIAIGSTPAGSGSTSPAPTTSPASSSAAAAPTSAAPTC